MLKLVKKQIPAILVTILIAAMLVTFNRAAANTDEMQISYISSFPSQMVGSAFTSNGTLFAGDTNNHLYRSDDNGSSFRLIYTFPEVSSTSNFKGYAWNIFFDSRGYIFVSIIGSNSLYRSTDFGNNFNKVLNINGTQTDGLCIAITEDSNGNLYVATYCNSVFPNFPPILKSTDGGGTWAVIAEFSTVHYHNIKFNPYNGYLYVVTGEYAWGYPNGYAECILRSKDLGQTWTTVIQRVSNGSGNTLYGPILFYENWVYLGTEQASQTNWIDRFNDNGSKAFQPEKVYTFLSDSFPAISAVWLNHTMLFSTTPEFADGNSTIVASEDGTNWTIIKSSATSVSSRYVNTLTVNPQGRVFGSDGYNQTFVITQKATSEDTAPLTDPDSTPQVSTDPSASNNGYNQVLSTIVGLIVVVGFSLTGSVVAWKWKKKSSAKARK